MDKNAKRAIIELFVSLVLIASVLAAVYLYGFMKAVPYTAAACSVISVIVVANYLRISKEIKGGDADMFEFFTRNPTIERSREPCACSRCVYCGDDIVSGDKYIDLGGDDYHEDCFMDAAPGILFREFGATSRTAYDDGFVGLGF